MVKEEQLEILIKKISNIEDSGLDRAGVEKLKKKYWNQLALLKYQDPELVIADDIVAKLRVRSSDSQNPVIALLRIIGIFSGIVVTFPWVMLFSCLKYFDGLWRKLGVSRHSLPTSWVVYIWCQVMLLISGVKIYTYGKEKVQKLRDSNEASIGMYQHTSNLDPFLLGAGSPLRYKFIAKREVTRIPIVGWMMTFVDNAFPIDRSNRNQAIATLDVAAEAIVEKNISIAISPEGTRSAHGQLNEFKMGPFHMSKKTNVPIVPILITGANALWPHGQLFPSEGSVGIRFMDPIRDYENEEVHEFRDNIRKLMLKEDGEDFDFTDLSQPGIFHKILSLITTFVMYVLFYYHLKYIYFAPIWWLSTLFF